MRRDWPLLARTLNDLGLAVTVISNGVLVNAESIRSMQEAGVFGLSISLDGNRFVHDKIRVATHGSTLSSYESAINAIRLGVSSRLKTAVITLVHRQNIGHLREIYDLLASLGVLVWQVQICMPLGRMLRHKSDLLIEPAQIPALEQELAALIDEGRLRIAVGDNIGYYGRHEPTLRGSVKGTKSFWMGCFAGCRFVERQRNSPETASNTGDSGR